MTTNIMRVDEIAVPDFLSSLGLQDKIFVQMLFLHSDGFFHFCDPSKKFGNPNSVTGIYIAFFKNHFFLAKPLKIQVYVIFGLARYLDLKDHWLACTLATVPTLRCTVVYIQLKRRQNLTKEIKIKKENLNQILILFFFSIAFVSH